MSSTWSISNASLILTCCVFRAELNQSPTEREVRVRSHPESTVSAERNSVRLHRFKKAFKADHN